MSGGSKERNDEALVNHLASGKSPTDAGEAAGVGRSTVYRRLEDPEFRQQVIEQRALLVESITSRVTVAADAAVQRIEQLLAADSEYVQLSAARTLLDQMIRLRDVVEFESRIRKVEELCQKSED
jgi:hypothetical protein